MADIPADNPVITVPQQVLANNSLLLAPASVVKSKVKAGGKSPSTANKRNREEKMLDLIYKNIMVKVKILPMSENKNPLVRSVGYGAWTQNSNLIFYNYDIIDQDFLYLKPSILYHEGTHILQFKKNGYQHPSSFMQMLKFEMDSYHKTVKWLEDDNLGLSFYSLQIPIISDDYEIAVKENKDSRDAVMLVWLKSLARVVIKVVRRYASGVLSIFSSSVPLTTAPTNISTEEIFFENMRNNDFLPKIRTKPYNVEDLYRKGKSQKDKDRFIELGYDPID